MTVTTLEKKDSIIDASVPSAGRVYDYLLGGHHNFEVDRQAAERLLELQPFMAKVMRLQRWCLQDIAEEMTVRRGYDTVIDFASGLPTNDHLHHVVPEGTTVIYSDYDPVVVEYAREILGDTPNVHFFKADACRPEELLYSPEVEEILDGKRDVALIYWGVSIFLTDEEFTSVPRTLYDWAGPGTCWAFNAQASEINPNDPAVQPEDSYELMQVRAKEKNFNFPYFPPAYELEKSPVTATRKRAAMIITPVNLRYL